MGTADLGRAAIVVRGDRARPDRAAVDNPRLVPVVSALRDVGFVPTWCLFAEDTIPEARRDLEGVDVVLVWVDPIAGRDDRSALDPLLRDVAAHGALVSAHPDAILRMGTKQVLYDTRDLGWGSDVDLYRTVEEFRDHFPARLATADGARVLKQYRGNGGIGVLKVELIDHTAGEQPGIDATVRVQAARPRDHVTEDIPLGQLLTRCTKYFNYAEGDGRIIDQPFQLRITEGIIRCYLVKNEVIGFCRQYPTGMSTAHQAAHAPAQPTNVFGLPSAKTMFPPGEPSFATLKRNLEAEWLPQMQGRVNVDFGQLPLLWDADFLFGPPDHDGRDAYVLCEINASAVTPFPDDAPRKLAAAAAAAVRQH